MGCAVAAAAQEEGHDVRMVLGPVTADVPDVDRVDVVTAEEMLSAVSTQLEWCDVLIMTAAVADWRPTSVSASKLKKGDKDLTLKLESTQDILLSVGALKGKRCFVGFAAESQDLMKNASSKLAEKNLDMVVANDITRNDSGFASDNNQVTIIYADGQTEDLPLMSKHDLGKVIVSRIMQICSS
jgi:phosphopantothenoylcysteine decarboxylase/phosphopantothenate--cysteine ligase